VKCASKIVLNFDVFCNFSHALIVVKSFANFSNKLLNKILKTALAHAAILLQNLDVKSHYSTLLAT